ncbi:hypothetical protein LZ30DRAFT_718322 [Colletotrichum cereale]|nr:hypothetical protein LZ30DRAFT_718322 [Colletotrichum cereale]
MRQVPVPWDLFIILFSLRHAQTSKSLAVLPKVFSLESAVIYSKTDSFPRMIQISVELQSLSVYKGMAKTYQDAYNSITTDYNVLDRCHEIQIFVQSF